MSLITPRCRYDGTPVEFFGQLCADCDPAQPVGLDVPDPLMEIVRVDLERMMELAE